MKVWKYNNAFYK